MSADLTLDEARTIIRRAVEKSHEVQSISAHAVVDKAGNLISLSRDDDAPAAAAAVARSKAYLAAVTCRKTLLFAERMDEHPQRFAGYQSILSRPLFPGPGAMPIVKEGKCVGGYSSNISSHQGGMKIVVDGETLSRADIVTAYALQIPYDEQHEDVP